MSAPSIVTEQLAPSRAQGGRFWGSTLSDYWALTKPEVNFLILITTAVGFYLGCGNEARPLSVILLFNTLLGTLLVASAATIYAVNIYRHIEADLFATILLLQSLPFWSAVALVWLERLGDYRLKKISRAPAAASDGKHVPKQG